MSYDSERNAKEEILTLEKEAGAPLAHARIARKVWRDGELRDVFQFFHFPDMGLPDFLDALDWEYDAGYGSWEVTGYLVFANGKKAVRGEYDGAEWWHIVPRARMSKEEFENNPPEPV